MSNTTDAWEELYTAQTEAVGEIRATVNGTNARAIITEVALDEIFAAGGLAEGGGFTLQMLASDFAVEPPKFTPVLARGQNLQVLGVNNNGGILYITSGDPVAKE